MLKRKERRSTKCPSLWLHFLSSKR